MWVGREDTEAMMLLRETLQNGARLFRFMAETALTYRECPRRSVRHAAACSPLPRWSRGLALILLGEVFRKK